MNFWFTGCKPCVAELSKLNELNDAIKSMGGEVVGVNTDTFDGKEATIKEAKKILESQEQNTEISHWMLIQMQENMPLRLWHFRQQFL